MTLQAIRGYHGLSIGRLYCCVFMADKMVGAISFQEIADAFSKPEQEIIIGYATFDIISCSEVLIPFVFLPYPLGTGGDGHGLLPWRHMLTEDGGKGQTDTG
jgi:hypothetical protein